MCKSHTNSNQKIDLKTKNSESVRGRVVQAANSSDVNGTAGKTASRFNRSDRKYSIIYADPPWFYNPRPNGKGRAFGVGAQGHYPVMRTEDICSLPVADIADRNCMLFLWTTFPCLQDGLQVISSWGFTYKTVGFTWVKLNKRNGKPFFGVGYYTKSNAEVCLLATKGKPIKVSNSVSSVIFSPREKHSKKPACRRLLLLHRHQGSGAQVGSRRRNARGVSFR